MGLFGVVAFIIFSPLAELFLFLELPFILRIILKLISESFLKDELQQEFPKIAKLLYLRLSNSHLTLA
jgi:hypothetical protein